MNRRRCGFGPPCSPLLNVTVGSFGHPSSPFPTAYATVCGGGPRHSVDRVPEPPVAAHAANAAHVPRVDRLGGPRSRHPRPGSGCRRSVPPASSSAVPPRLTCGETVARWQVACRGSPSTWHNCTRSCCSTSATPRCVLGKRLVWSGLVCGRWAEKRAASVRPRTAAGALHHLLDLESVHLLVHCSPRSASTVLRPVCAPGTGFWAVSRGRPGARCSDTVVG